MDEVREPDVVDSAIRYLREQSQRLHASIAEAWDNGKLEEVERLHEQLRYSQKDVECVEKWEHVQHLDQEEAQVKAELAVLVRKEVDMTKQLNQLKSKREHPNSLVKVLETAGQKAFAIQDLQSVEERVHGAEMSLHRYFQAIGRVQDQLEGIQKETRDALKYINDHWIGASEHPGTGYMDGLRFEIQAIAETHDAQEFKGRSFSLPFRGK